MKNIFILSLIVLSQGRMMFGGNWKSFTQTAETSKLDIVSGLFAGMALDSPSLALSPCLQDLEKISSELAAIVSSITNPTFMSLFKILKQLELALRDLPKAIKECMNELKPNVERLSSALNVIKNPKSAEYQEDSGLWINGVDVYGDLMMIQRNLAEKKWFDAGFAIGNVLNKLAAAE